MCMPCMHAPQPLTLVWPVNGTVDVGRERHGSERTLTVMIMASETSEERGSEQYTAGVW